MIPHSSHTANTVVQPSPIPLTSNTLMQRVHNTFEKRGNIAERLAIAILQVCYEQDV